MNGYYMDIKVIVLLFLVVCFVQFGDACVVPTDQMVISSDTDFCQGNYTLTNGISISSDNITIDCNNSIMNGGNYDCGQGSTNGILFSNHKNVTLKNCEIKYYLRAVMDVGESSKLINNTFNSVCLSIVSTQNYLTIINNNFTNSKHHSFYGSISHSNLTNNYFKTGNGLSFFGDCYNNTIQDNTFETGGTAFYFSGWGTGDWEVGSWKIIGNHIDNRSTGFSLHSFHNSIISNNTITNNNRGFWMTGSNNNTISNNTISNNTKSTTHTEYFLINTSECQDLLDALENSSIQNLSVSSPECAYNVTTTTVENTDFYLQGSNTGNVFVDNIMDTLSFSLTENGTELTANLELNNASELNDSNLNDVEISGNVSHDNITIRLGLSLNLSGLLSRENYNNSYFLFESITLGENESLFYIPDDNETFYESPACTNNSMPLIVPNTGCYVTFNSDIILYVPHFSTAVVGELINSESEPEVVPEVEGGSSGSGSSGGGGAPSNKLILQFFNESQIKNKQTLSLSEGEKVDFRMSNSHNHSLHINNVTNDSVSFIVSSDPINFTLFIGEEKRLNLTNPDYYDFYIKLQTISDNEVNLTIQEINETISDKEKNNNLSGFIIIMTSLILVIGVSCLIFFLNKRKRKSKERS